jgi:hypothetical protein
MDKPVYRQLQTNIERNSLSKALGDKPETVIWNHVLSLGLCNAYLAGALPDYQAVVVQAINAISEPRGFGSDAGLIWELLKQVQGWTCILVDRSVAPELGQIIHTQTGHHIRYLADINYEMSGIPASFHDPFVRLLTLADLDLLDTSPAELQGTFWHSNQALLENSFAAGAIIDGRLVATACCSSLTQCYADIGVNTLPEFRNRGFATAAAFLVARAIHDAGRTPVWSTGGHNLTSQRIAAKLGFTEVIRETYILLENSPGFSNGKDTPSDKLI